MRSRRLPSCVLLTIALAGFAASGRAQSPATSTEAEPQGPTLEQAEANVRAIRATLKDPASPPQTWGVLMMSEIVVLRLKAEKAAAGGAIDEAALAVEQRKMRERVFAEWKTTRPGDSTPYLAEMQGSVPPERMDDAVLGLVPRFPDDPRLLGRAVQILSRREQAKQASELIEAALERHPESSDFYGIAVNFFNEVNETRRHELVEAWIERRPGDANALRTFLGEPPSSRDPRESARRVERFVAAGGASLPRIETCGWLLQIDRGAYRRGALPRRGVRADPGRPAPREGRGVPRRRRRGCRRRRPGAQPRRAAGAAPPGGDPQRRLRPWRRAVRTQAQPLQAPAEGQWRQRRQPLEPLRRLAGLPDGSAGPCRLSRGLRSRAGRGSLRSPGPLVHQDQRPVSGGLRPRATHRRGARSAAASGKRQG